jgi:hypothetical protein
MFGRLRIDEHIRMKRVFASPASETIAEFADRLGLFDSDV